MIQRRCPRVRHVAFDEACNAVRAHSEANFELLLLRVYAGLSTTEIARTTRNRANGQLSGSGDCKAMIAAHLDGNDSSDSTRSPHRLKMTMPTARHDLESIFAEACELPDARTVGVFESPLRMLCPRDQIERLPRQPNVSTLSTMHDAAGLTLLIPSATPAGEGIGLRDRPLYAPRKNRRRRLRRRHKANRTSPSVVRWR